MLKRLFWLRSKYIEYFLFKIGILQKFSKKELKARTFFGREFIFPIDDLCGMSLRCFGMMPNAADMRLAKYLLRRLKPGGIFYDVGANHGFYAMLAEALGSEVHLFEADPAICTYCARNFPNVPVNNVFVGEKVGAVSFNIGIGQTGDGGSMIPPLDGEPYRTISARSISLDEYAKTHHPPTFIKIDVEGAEPDVAKGAHNILENQHPEIVMEIWSNSERHASAARYLYEAGYDSFAIDPKGTLVSLSNLDDPANVKVSDNFMFIWNDRQNVRQKS